MIGDVDLAQVLSDVEGHAIKGMFLSRHADEVWEAVHHQLIDPPPRGKYHAFEWYPMGDYARLFDHAARARFPGSAREAYRLLGRSEIEVFAASTLGRVTFSMLGDPAAALLRYPEVLSVVWRGPASKAERLGPNRVKVSFEGAVGAAVEHVLGAIEGIVIEFDARPTLEVEIDTARRYSFYVSW